MSEKPLISVIVPVFNTASFLRKCLDSICNQTYCNLEILCVNDGSTDNSSIILEEYASKDRRIKVFTQSNAGLSAARNTALQHATGEWITGVDSDDYLELDAYEYALKGTGDEIDIICFGSRVVWERAWEGEELQQYMDLKYINSQVATPELIKNTNVTFCCKLWRKSLIDSFNQKFPINLLYEDTYFFLTLAPFARLISYMPDKKYNYIQRSGTITSKTNSIKAIDSLLIARNILNFFHQHPLPPSQKYLDLIAFEICFFSRYTSCAEPVYFLRTAQSIAKNYSLINRYPQKLRFLKQVPLLLRPFIKRSITKSSYGIFGLPIITVTFRNNTQVIRFLGIKINKKEIQC